MNFQLTEFPFLSHSSPVFQLSVVSGCQSQHFSVWDQYPSSPKIFFHYSKTSIFGPILKVKNIMLRFRTKGKLPTKGTERTESDE